MTNVPDPRTIERGADRWLTDSRVYNLVWLGRWFERAQTIARVVRWAAMQNAAPGRHDIESVLGMAASIRGLSVGTGETALDLLLTRGQLGVFARIPCRCSFQRNPGGAR